MKLRWLCFSLIVIGSTRLIWVGDTFFQPDEHTLVQNAISSNSQGILAQFANTGNKGLKYGPFPVWIYQFHFLWLKNLIAALAANIIFVTSLTAISLIRLSRLLPRLRTEVILIPFLSPYLWLYSRTFSDSFTFHIPLSVFVCASYLQFCKNHSFLSLFMMGLGLSFGFLTHPVGVPLAIGIGFHFMFFHSHFFLKHPIKHCLALSPGVVVSVPYLNYLLTHQGQSKSLALYKPASIFFSFCGPILLSAIDVGRYYGADWFKWSQSFEILNYSVLALSLFSAIIYFFCWHGIYEAIKLCVSHKQKDPYYSALTLALVTLGADAVFNFVLGLVSYPQYYDGIWIIYFLFSWYSISQLWTKSLTSKLVICYMLALTVCSAFLALKVHFRGPDASRYGLTLKYQIENGTQGP